MKQKRIRPIPYENPHNPFITLYLSSIRKRGFLIETFKWWKVSSLAQKNIVFHLHWPEAIYRDRSFIKSFLKAIRFIVFFYLHKANANRWVFFLHNIEPHRNINFFSNLIDSLVFKILLRGSNEVIGLSKNTFEDVNNKYKISIEHKYRFVEHFLYPINKIANKTVLSNFIGQDLSFEYLLTFGSNERNKGTEILIQEFPEINNCKLVVVGGNHNVKKNKNVIHINEFPNSEIFNSLIKYSMGVILNYDQITTSGMFFHCMSLQKATVVPKLNFFLETSSKKSSIFYSRPIDKIKLIKIIDDLKYSQFCIDRKFNSVDDFTNEI